MAPLYDGHDTLMIIKSDDFGCAGWGCPSTAFTGFTGGIGGIGGDPRMLLLVASLRVGSDTDSAT